MNSSDESKIECSDSPLDFRAVLPLKPRYLRGKAYPLLMYCNTEPR